MNMSDSLTPTFLAKGGRDQMDRCDYYPDHLVKTAAMVLTVQDALKERRCRLVTMESCTAGGIANAVSLVKGASRYLIGGYVVYDNEQKVGVGVDSEKIRRHTEVSHEVARNMSLVAYQRACRTHPCEQAVAVSTTGNIDDRAKVFMGFTSPWGDPKSVVVHLSKYGTRWGRQLEVIHAALDFVLTELLPA